MCFAFSETLVVKKHGFYLQIPLSGYGGSSNIILEDQRKQGDGYVATMKGVAAGRVSKVCLCVRNTGSRAAFIKALAFSDLQTRSLMEPSVVSVAPSQFVLKERTQEVGEGEEVGQRGFRLACHGVAERLQVVTVLMKATQREQSLCQAAGAQVASLCLFCGDEVSRQQYRR